MKKSYRILAIMLMTLAVIGITSCDLFLTLMAAPKVAVVDARTGSPISGVTVTLTPISIEEGYESTPVNAISDSSGLVAFGDIVAYGDYTVTGAKTGYAFIPFEATVAGWNTDLGKMYGAAATTTKDGQSYDSISIFLLWDSAKDVDAHFTYPASFETNGAAVKGTWSDTLAYYDLTTDSDRTHIYWSDKDGDGSSDYGVSPLDTTVEVGYATLDVDKNVATGGYGPETISLVGQLTGSAPSSGLTPVTATTPYIGSVLAAGNYYYMGAGEYYLDAFSADTNLNTQGVRVAITQGTEVLGIFNMPSAITMKTISLFRVQLFYNEAGDKYYMVFMPDMRLVADNDTAIKSLTSIPTDSVFVVSGSK